MYPFLRDGNRKHQRCLPRIACKRNPLRLPTSPPSTILVIVFHLVISIPFLAHTPHISRWLRLIPTDPVTAELAFSVTALQLALNMPIPEKRDPAGATGSKRHLALASIAAAPLKWDPPIR